MNEEENQQGTEARQSGNNTMDENQHVTGKREKHEAADEVDFASPARVLLGADGGVAINRMEDNGAQSLLPIADNRRNEATPIEQSQWRGFNGNENVRNEKIDSGYESWATDGKTARKNVNDNHVVINELAANLSGFHLDASEERPGATFVLVVMGITFNLYPWQYEAYRPDEDRDTGLHIACYNWDEESLVDVLKACPHHYFLDMANDKGLTALMAATLRNSPRFIRILMDAGANLEKQDNQGFTALHWACGKGYIDCVIALTTFVPVEKRCVKHGYPTVEHAVPQNMSVMDTAGRTALHLAAQFGFPQIMKHLVNEAKCSPDVMDGCTGNTALHDAIQRGQTRVAEFLITELGADFMKPNQAGYTPLSMARRYQSQYLTTLLARQMQERGYQVDLEMLEYYSSSGHSASSSSESEDSEEEDMVE